MSTSGDRQRAARGLAHQFPGVSAWYGEQTGEFWAMVPLRTGVCLLSAPDLRQLREQIISARTNPWPHR